MDNDLLAEFFIPLVPKPSNARKAAIVGGHARVVQATAVKSHQAAIAIFAERHRPSGGPLNCPLAVKITFVMPRLLAMSKLSKKTGMPLMDPKRVPHASRPDIDNLTKSVLDGLRSWWVDDSLVQRLAADKWYAGLQEDPGYHIKIMRA